MWNIFGWGPCLGVGFPGVVGEVFLGISPLKKVQIKVPNSSNHSLYQENSIMLFGVQFGPLVMEVLLGFNIQY